MKKYSKYNKVLSFIIFKFNEISGLLTASVLSQAKVKKHGFIFTGFLFCSYINNTKLELLFGLSALLNDLDASNCATPSFLRRFCGFTLKLFHH